MPPTAPRITVLGSINMDLVIRCENLVRPGETVHARSSSEVCGGKGANQAVAAARAGGLVSMVGRVGDDAFAERLLANLRREGVATEHVRAAEDCASGLAVVAVERTGQNAIYVVGGANARLSVEDVAAARATIQASDLLLLQLEVPLAAVLAARRIAQAAGVRVILDPAPAPRRFPEELLQVDLLCPNESEASVLLGTPVEDEAQAASAARELQRRGAAHVAVTLGGHGTLLCDGDSTRRIPAPHVTAVDTTAAGDAFAGALAVFWAEGQRLEEAVARANAAGAIAASRHGAQPGMGNRSEIEALWRNQV
jgi:ribokinase